GADRDIKVLNTVLIYNIKTEKYHMLPEMKYKRAGCVAVVVENSIVVMGGKDERGNNINSVESFSFDRYSWEDLPPMNEARFAATAVAW
ncbi:kelch repeat-containing protein, partial [Salmonella sp. s54412]|uniref:kelch repeat-containing protein n=1 Tax=Salmonella sp. s54412 TaxID=3160128 RepID=UPI003753FA15